MVVYSQIYYRSRRGIKELDLVLLPFSEKQFPLLSTEEQELYSNLLSQEDQVLWDWFFLLEFPVKKEYHHLITKILNFYKSYSQEQSALAGTALS
jgi:antitoxin CptB